MTIRSVGESSDAGGAALTRALAECPDTRVLEVGHGVLGRTPVVFEQLFGGRPAVVVADVRTFEAAGCAVADHLRAAGVECREPFVYAQSHLPAEYEPMQELEAELSRHNAIPVAVGSGTINDLVKLAAHRAGRRYLCVGTAASMDGYAAFGASLTYQGSKQTFNCPAPLGIVADLDVLAAAPAELGAAGYADLLAKVPAGADWLLADALGEEAIDLPAWDLVQGPLRAAVSDPHGVRSGSPDALRQLLTGLISSGLGMQRTQTSRPASGAEHQFSHLWDMEHHRFAGKAPSHGFKVGIGTLAVARLYERLLELPLDELDVDQCCSAWPLWETVDASLAALFGEVALREKAREETHAKHPSREALRAHLLQLRTAWPELRNRLRAHLLPADELAEMLRAAGAPDRPEQIGISPERLRRGHVQAYHIRRRYTALDLAVRTGTLEAALADP